MYSVKIEILNVIADHRIWCSIISTRVQIRYAYHQLQLSQKLTLIAVLIFGHFKMNDYIMFDMARF